MIGSGILEGRRKMRRSLALPATCLLAAAAPANTTTTYSYDALGRVKVVETRGTGGTGALDAYAYDPSSNRRQVQSSGAFRGALLVAPSQLNSGETLLSNDARFRFVMQFDGDLALYDQSDALIWHVAINTGSFAAMQTDGNFVVYDAAGRAVWNTQTAGSGGSFIGVQPDGNIVLYDTKRQSVWSTGTSRQ